MKKYIRVRTDFVAYHKWEDAPEEVAFLKNLHRHKFQVACMIEVFHLDRELEFFMVLNKLEQDILPYMQIQQVRSCEWMAEFIGKGLQNVYGRERHYQIVVSEDGENDAIVVLPAEKSRSN